MNGSAWLETLFPKLSSAAYGITSPESEAYNCVAWAMKEDERLWWPEPFGGYYWPNGIPKEETLDAFIALFASKGYELCDDGSLEEGFEKVAFYVDEEGVPTHVARQLENGRWTSKLGDLEDIEHELAGITGDRYGSIAVFMKRELGA